MVKVENPGDDSYRQLDLIRCGDLVSLKGKSHVHDDTSIHDGVDTAKQLAIGILVSNRFSTSPKGCEGDLLFQNAENVSPLLLLLKQPRAKGEQQRLLLLDFDVQW